MLERFLDKMIQRSQLPLLVHAVGWRVECQVDFDSTVGGAKVASPNKESTHQVDRRRTAENVVTPGRSVGPLCNACRNTSWLAPCASSGPQICPPLVGEKILESRKIRGVSVDVPDQEGRAIPTKLVVADNCLDDGVSSRSFGGVAM